MEYSKIIAVTGMPGLYELLSSKSDGAIVRSLDDKSTKFVSSRIHNFSHLESIEVFTVRENVNLVDIFHAMEKEGGEVPDGKDNATLKKYFEKIYPDLDFERVYSSDLKKMAKWYDVLKTNEIDIKLSKAPEEESTKVEEEEEKIKDTPKVETKQEEKIVDKPKVETKQEEKIADKPKVETKQEEKIADKPKAETKQEEKIADKPKAETKQEEKIADKPKAETKQEEKIADEPKVEAKQNKKVTEEPKVETKAEKGEKKPAAKKKAAPKETATEPEAEKATKEAKPKKTAARKKKED